MFNKKNFKWLDSNLVPLESEATALPTEPQPLPLLNCVIVLCGIVFYSLIHVMVSLVSCLPNVKSGYQTQVIIRRSS